MSTTTVRMKAAEIYKDWHVIDAADRPLGRVAAEAAHILRGKHKPTFEPHLDCGDFVIVVNSSRVRVGGNKTRQKMYYRHSGFPGGLKARSFEQQLAFKPERIIEQAVWGMLPSGPLGKQMFKHLKVYPGASHPHQSQVTGSERARVVRDAAVADAITANAAKKPPRLRPLSVPHTLAGVFDEIAEEPATQAPVAVVAAVSSEPELAATEPQPEAVEAEATPRRRRTRRPAADTTATTETEASE